jgi:CheY-like chemotaxis protein
VATQRILVVEDEVLIRLVLAEILLDEGFEVYEAQDGDEAIQILSQETTPDLIITDITMPGGADGNIVAKAAKQRFPSIPIVYSTGRPGSVTNSLDDNDVVIAKPYGRNDILPIVRRLMTRADR